GGQASDRFAQPFFAPAIELSSPFFTLTGELLVPLDGGLGARSGRGLRRLDGRALGVGPSCWSRAGTLVRVGGRVRRRPGAVGHNCRGSGWPVCAGLPLRGRSGRLRAPWPRRVR